MSKLSPDWQALFLSPNEFQALTGVAFQDAQQLCRAAYTSRGIPKRRSWLKRLRKYLWNGLWFSVVWAILLGIIAVPITIGGFYLARLLGWVLGFNFVTLLQWSIGFCFLTGIPMSGWFSYDEEQKENSLRSLLPLTQEVEKFNRLVRAADVNDQLGIATGKNVTSADRADAIETLSQLRSQIENALKVERVLRENQDVVTAQVDMAEGATVGNYAQLMADQAVEYRQVLDEALKLGDRVRVELKTLHDRHDP
ncbi:MAG TPA: hypothetical protein V6D46_06310 [Coleofasciculaceae cyanobacterium]